MFPKAKLLKYPVEAVGLSLELMEGCLLVLGSCLEIIKQQSQRMFSLILLLTSVLTTFTAEKPRNCPFQTHL